MVNYRRNLVAGGTYFFTVTLHDRRTRTLVDHVSALRNAVRATRQAQPFSLDAAVILPEHLHMIWTLPPDDADYAGRWRAIKSLFTRAMVKTNVTMARNRRGEYALWQRRYWEHTIRDERDLARHVDYIHYNPVKHGLVRCVRDWPWSSFHRCVRGGVYRDDWGGHAAADLDGRFGE